MLSAIFGVLSAVPYGSKYGGGGGVIGIEPAGHIGISGSGANAGASSLSSGNNCKKIIKIKNY